MAEDSPHVEDSLPDWVHRAEEGGAQRPLLPAGTVPKVGLGILAMLIVTSIAIRTVFILRVAKFPWLP